MLCLEPLRLNVGPRWWVPGPSASLLTWYSTSGSSDELSPLEIDLESSEEGPLESVSSNSGRPSSAAICFLRCSDIDAATPAAATPAPAAWLFVRVRSRGEGGRGKERERGRGGGLQFWNQCSSLTSSCCCCCSSTERLLLRRQV